MNILVKSGFTFFKDLENGKIILENKFSGLRLLYDEQSGTWETIE